MTHSTIQESIEGCLREMYPDGEGYELVNESTPEQLAAGVCVMTVRMKLNYIAIECRVGEDVEVTI